MSASLICSSQQEDTLMTKDSNIQDLLSFDVSAQNCDLSMIVHQGTKTIRIEKTDHDNPFILVMSIPCDEMHEAIPPQIGETKVTVSVFTDNNLNNGAPLHQKINMP